MTLPEPPFLDLLGRIVVRGNAERESSAQAAWRNMRLITSRHRTRSPLWDVAGMLVGIAASVVGVGFTIHHPTFGSAILVVIGVCTAAPAYRRRQRPVSHRRHDHPGSSLKAAGASLVFVLVAGGWFLVARHDSGAFQILGYALAAASGVLGVGGLVAAGVATWNRSRRHKATR